MSPQNEIIPGLDDRATLVTFLISGENGRERELKSRGEDTSFSATDGTPACRAPFHGRSRKLRGCIKTSQCFIDMMGILLPST